ncbi:hypothetical protein XENOCAPTIV_028365 [Xenoophorus captivus]|uniref:Secreted protein n=1 Tax=Xenoophorus captivus TaxID=1517983 RepID=A0ABV0RM94_9TELE
MRLIITTVHQLTCACWWAPLATILFRPELGRHLRLAAVWPTFFPARRTNNMRADGAAARKLLIKTVEFVSYNKQPLDKWRGSRGSGPKPQWCLLWLEVLCCNSVSINEREGAVRGRGSSTGPGRQGPKAALLGAGEASEEVTQTVKLSCWDCCVVGGCW